MNSAGMLTSPGWRARFAQRNVILVFTLGATLGGLTSASLLWLVSGTLSLLPITLRHVTLLAFVAFVVGIELRLVHVHLPENRRLVPKVLFDRGPLRASLQFGFELGTGVRTYISSTAPYLLVLVIALLAPSVTAVAIVGVGFGIGRSLMTWLRYVAPDKERWDRDLEAMQGTVSIVSTGSLCLWIVWMVVGGLA